MYSEECRSDFHQKTSNFDENPEYSGEYSGKFEQNLIFLDANFKKISEQTLIQKN